MIRRRTPPELPETAYSVADPAGSSEPYFSYRSPHSTEPLQSFTPMMDVGDHSAAPFQPSDPEPLGRPYTFSKFESNPQYEPASDSNTETRAGSFDSVDQALLDIKRRYGYGEEFEASEAIQPESELIPEEVDEATPAISAIHSPRLDEVSSMSVDPSLENLRAQLAQMFSYNTDESLEKDSVDDAVERPVDLIDDTANAYREDLLDVPDAQPNENIDLLAGMEEAESVDDQPDVQEESSNDDPWTRRLRELTSAAPQSSPPPVPVEPEPIDSGLSSNDDDDEYSVEAQIARLLGRPRAVESLSKSSTNRPNSESDSAMTSVPEVDMTDRSHLAAEPKHRQNKNAVREEVQSFRAVAQMSARTALAKHSWNTLRNEFYFTCCLTVAASAGALWFLTNYMSHKGSGLWEGLTCSLGAGVCLHKMLSSYGRLKQIRKIKPQRPAPESPSDAEGDADPSMAEE